MRTLTFILWSAGIVAVLNSPLFSDTTPPPPPRTPLEALQQMKTQNAALIEKQTATLLKLDELAKEAQQLKFLGKRS